MYLNYYVIMASRFSRFLFGPSSTEIVRETVKNNKLSIFRDPFRGRSVTQAVIWTYNMDHPENEYRYGEPFEMTVYFKNGDTSGQQKLKAKSLKDLLRMYGSLVDELDDK